MINEQRYSYVRTLVFNRDSTANFVKGTMITESIAFDLTGIKEKHYFITGLSYFPVIGDTGGVSEFYFNYDDPLIFSMFSMYTLVGGYIGDQIALDVITGSFVRTSAMFSPGKYHDLSACPVLYPDTRLNGQIMLCVDNAYFLINQLNYNFSITLTLGLGLPEKPLFPPEK